MLPLQDHEDAVMRIALIHDHGACLYFPLLAKCGQARDLRVIQAGEHRIGSSGDRRASAND